MPRGESEGSPEFDESLAHEISPERLKTLEDLSSAEGLEELYGYLSGLDADTFDLFTEAGVDFRALSYIAPGENAEEALKILKQMGAKPDAETMQNLNEELVNLAK